MQKKGKAAWARSARGQEAEQSWQREGSGELGRWLRGRGRVWEGPVTGPGSLSFILYELGPTGVSPIVLRRANQSVERQEQGTQWEAVAEAHGEGRRLKWAGKVTGECCRVPVPPTPNSSHLCMGQTTGRRGQARGARKTAAFWIIPHVIQSTHLPLPCLVVMLDPARHSGLRHGQTPECMSQGLARADRRTPGRQPQVTTLHLDRGTDPQIPVWTHSLSIA